MNSEKSGVGQNVISLPEGGGAIQGIGEKFSPDLFTGTGNFSVPIGVPMGRNGLQPKLTLGYSSGSGNGPFGQGWNIGLPSVSRKTNLGIPRYQDKEDVFVLSGAEDLVPVDKSLENENGVLHRKTTYKPRTEGLFARIEHHKIIDNPNDTVKDYWEVRTKDGLITWYGNPNATQESADRCVLSDPENPEHIATWMIYKTQDTFGNHILYEYSYDSAGLREYAFSQVYLDRVKYVDYEYTSGTKYLCSLQVEYEERPDFFSSFRTGFEVKTKKRCKAIHTFTHPKDADLPDGYTADPEGNSIPVKSYKFEYASGSEMPSNGTSMLKRLQVEGHHLTETESMPPLDFNYTEFSDNRRNMLEIDGDHLPTLSLNHPDMNLADLDGNGLPDLVQISPGQPIRYWTNRGNGKFDKPRQMKESPAGVSLRDAGVQLMDADGDGRIDLVVNNDKMAGFFPLDFNGQWDRRGFRKYDFSLPVNLGSAEVQFADLTGDGRTDVMINAKRIECYFQNSPKRKVAGAAVEDSEYLPGWSERRSIIPGRDTGFPDVSFNDPRIRMADMTGDGLQDVVYLTNGNISYWPNLGYGEFGAKRTMKNAPRLGFNYDPRRLIMGDINGDGLIDMLYVKDNSVSYFINQTGQGWGEEQVIKGTPRFTSRDTVQVVDLMGTGTPGILWSVEPASSRGTRFYYLDLTEGKRPYVLSEMVNNMGSRTRVEYRSSTEYYLRDRYGLPVFEDTLSDQAGYTGRWKTHLPFPVQVVSKVESIDDISGGKLVTRYFYHHGYWDGGEREFRGFGRVDQLDTETFTRYNEGGLFSMDNLQSVDQEHYSPPVLTKNWFHLGPVGAERGDWREMDFSAEYWEGDQQMLSRAAEMNAMLASLPRRARRDAFRTLRGASLRSEVYAIDGTYRQDKPYSVAETQTAVRLEESPQDNETIAEMATLRNSNYIFFSYKLASRNTAWERGTDPLTKFTFTGELDAYGQVKDTLSISVPRGKDPLTGNALPDALEDGSGDDYWVLWNKKEFIYPDPEIGPYMFDRVSEDRVEQITDQVTGSVFDVRDGAFDESLSPTLLNHALHYYDGTAYNPEDLGEIGNHGALVETEELVITNSQVTNAYGSSTPAPFQTSPDWSAHPSGFVNELDDSRLGYIYNDSAPHVTGYYRTAEKKKYDFQEVASSDKGLVIAMRDAFDNEATIDFDDYDLMPEQVTLPGGMQQSSENDYRVLKPFKVTDINSNITEFLFNPLGLLTEKYALGKDDGTEGDTASDPSVKMEYDLFSWFDEGLPVWVKTIQRAHHKNADYLSSLPSAEQDATITSVEYSDGFGRLLQTRAQAEDVIFGDSELGDSGLEPLQPPSGGGSSSPVQPPNPPAEGLKRESSDPFNVVVSGWKIYNNKGKVVEQWEPYYSSGFDYQEEESHAGQKIKMYYDGPGRMIRTVNPDDSENRVYFGRCADITDPEDFTPTPWERYSYDANDLAGITHPGGTSVPQDHKYTPKSETMDALGNVIQTTEHQAHHTWNTIEDVVMKYEFDIKGRLLHVLDPYDRDVFIYKYDALDKPLYTDHIDSGESTVVYDVLDNPVMTLDAKGAESLHNIDHLVRPTHVWAKNKTGDSFTLRNHLQYGDDAGLSSPEDDNLKGQVYLDYDEAGLTQFPEYDFKGNLLEKRRQVIKDSELKTVFDGPPVNWDIQPYVVDWDGLNTSILETKKYITEMKYDALNRVREMILPENVDSNRESIIPQYNRAGALDSVTYDSEVFVRTIAYNAKGQRILIAFGNDVMTRYAYDDETFRLLRQRSEKYTRSVQGERIFYEPISGNNRQDDGYQYDLVGNILEINHRKSECGVGGTDSLDRTFAYDPLNRLLEATGRENVPSGGYPMPGWDDTTRDATANNTVGYTRRYRYDKLGNIDLINQVGTNSFTRTFKYPLSGGSQVNNKLSQVLIGSNTTNYTYDDNGNQLTEHSNRHFKWDAKDQLVLFKDQAGTSAPTVAALYLYDSQGNRVKKLVRKDGKYEIRTYIDGVFEYFTDERYEQNTVHIMDDKSRIATVRLGYDFGDSTPEVKYVLENNIGSSSVQLDDSGGTVNEQEYYPFGETSFGSHGKKRYQYVGKERDEESGMYYYGARYYSPWIGRFVSVDPLANDYPHLNPYNYAGNKPINDIDIDGLQGSGEKTKPEASDSSNGENSSLMGQEELLDINVTQVRDKAYKRIEAPDSIEPKKFDDFNASNLSSPIQTLGLESDYQDYSFNEALPDNTKVKVTDLELLSEKVEAYSEAKEYSKLSEEEIIQHINNGILLLSISAESIEHLGGYEKAHELIKKGKFQMSYNSELKTWSLKFHGNQSVSSRIVAAGKSDFKSLAMRNTRILNVARGGGIILGVGSFGLSVYQFSQGQISGYELAADGVFTTIAMVGGPVGAAISITYFGLKAIYKSVPENFEEIYPYPSKNYRWGE